MLIGVCHFDDIETATSAWISVNGDQPRRISTRGELSSNIFWITNLMWNQYRKQNLSKIKNIQDAQFFRTSYILLSEEFGITSDVKEQVQFFSKVFTKIAIYCKEKLNVDISLSQYRLTTLLRDHLMPSSLRKAPEGPNSLEIGDAIKQSTQQLQIMTGNSPQGSKTHNFVFPRGGYTRILFGMKYPNGKNWEKLSEKNHTSIFGYEDNIQVRGTRATLLKLKEMSKTKAVFFKVTVLSQSPEYIGYQTFGSGANISRRWACLPEIIHLSRFSKLKIEGGYSCDLDDLKLNVPLKTDDYEFSIARSIFLESLSIGLSTPFKGDPSPFKAVGAYLRAYDRILCAKVAESFHREGGITVGSFGAGRVTCYLKETDMDFSNRIALEQGIIPSISNLKG